MAEHSKKAYEFGSFRIDASERLLRRGAEVIPLPPKAAATLVALVESAGQVLGKEELLKRIWHDTYVEEGVLAQNVSLLRKVLSGQAGPGEYIETIPKRGYRFAVPVKETGSSEPVIRSLLVLPLDNLSRDPDQEFFADGMTDELISYLMRIDALRVCSRTSSMAYKAARKPLREIAQELNVDWIVEGAVLHSGGRVRISVRVYEGTTERQMWADTYERSARDVLGLQAEVAGAIAREIRVRITTRGEASLPKSRTVNPLAYEAFLRGRYFWNKRTPEGLKKAIEYIRQAIDLDPTYGPAHAALADAFILMGSSAYDVMAPREAKPRARMAAKTALDLDDTLAAAHAALGNVAGSYDWNWPEAEKHFLRAIELDPTYATAHEWYAPFLCAMGRLEEAEQEARRANELDPLSLAGNFLRGYYLYFARRFDDALVHFRQMLEIFPDAPIIAYNMSLAYENKGCRSEALSEAERAMVLSNSSPAALMLMGRALAKSGRREEALKQAEALHEMTARRYVPPFYTACISAALGDKDEAFEWLEKAYQERTNYLMYLNVEPALDNLRTDPRFQDLVKRVGLPYPVNTK